MARPLQHQIIARALELIADEAYWTSLIIARTADNKPCGCLEPAATRFCALGALYRAASELLGDVEPALEVVKFVLAANNRPTDSLPHINDHEGHAAIVSMFKYALAR